MPRSESSKLFGAARAGLATAGRVDGRRVRLGRSGRSCMTAVLLRRLNLRCKPGPLYPMLLQHHDCLYVVVKLVRMSGH
jgi:hypothetical protein